MATNAALVRRETNSRLVFHAPTTVADDHLLANHRICRYDTRDLFHWSKYLNKSVAGTLITNFVGPFQLADEISSIITERLIEDHPMGRQSLTCVWVLAFTFLKTMAEQLDFAFEVFDPIESSLKANFSHVLILPKH